MSQAHFHDVYFINKQLGWMVGGSGTILYTKDGGATWKKASIANSIGSPPLASVSFADELHGFAVGGNGFKDAFSGDSNIILTTSDGGQTWQAMQP